MTDKTIDERKTEAAKALGLDESRIRTARLEFDYMRKTGVLLKVHVTGSSLFLVRASYAEYGVATNGKRKNTLAPGMRNLIPLSYIEARKSRETRARHLPKKFGHADLFNDDLSSYYWIPFTLWGEFDPAFLALVAEDDAWKADKVARREELLAWCRKNFASSASEAWDSLVLKRRLKPGDTLDVDGRKFINRKQFVEYVVDDAVSKFPTDDEIMGCGISLQISVLATSSDVAEESAREAKAEAEIIKASAESDKARSEAYERASAARVKIAAMQKVADEEARKQIAEMQPFARLMDSVRARLKDNLEDIKKSVGKNGGLRGKNAEQGANLINIYEMLSGGVADEELRNMVANFSAQCATPVERRSTAEVTKALEELDRELSQSASEILAQAPTRFKFLELD